MIESYKTWLRFLSIFLSEYRWLLDAYIIEYFTEDHWSKLPLCWRDALYSSDFDNLKNLLLFILGRNTSLPSNRVYPLSFLSFVATCNSLGSLTVTKDPNDTGWVGPTTPSAPKSQEEGLSHSFRRHVRLKKQHEVKLLGKVIADLSKQTSCRTVLDIGSGQGHLARYLAFQHGLDVITIEAVGSHAAAACKYDDEVRVDILKSKLKQEGQIRHVTVTVDADASVSDLLKVAGKAGQEVHHQSNSSGEGKFIVVGLHTCGDLAPTLLRLFSQSSEVVAVALVGCCYMKLTTNHMTTPQEGQEMVGYAGISGPAQEVSDIPLTSGAQPTSSQLGYPMSRFMRAECTHMLSYEARELACHAVEAIRDKLSGEGHLEKFKVHCHRAAVEIILRTRYGLQRTQVRISKRVSKLPFRLYAQKLLDSINLDGNGREHEPPGEIRNESLEVDTVSSAKEVTECLREECGSKEKQGAEALREGAAHDLVELEGLVQKEWKRVVVFFMLRQAMAPCVEQMILLDRSLFLMEQGYLNTCLFPLFDANLSPRNELILSTKPK